MAAESLEGGDRFLEDALEAEMPLLYVLKEYKVVGMGSAANIVGKNIYATACCTLSTRCCCHSTVG